MRWLKLDIHSKLLKQDTKLLAVSRLNLPRSATWGLSSSSAPDGLAIPWWLHPFPWGPPCADWWRESCTSRRWPQLLCLACASCWLRPDPSLPRALSFPAGLGSHMRPGMPSVSLASRTNNRRWRHPRSFSFLIICSKDDFPSLKTGCGYACNSSSLNRPSKRIE